MEPNHRDCVFVERVVSYNDCCFFCNFTVYFKKKKQTHKKEFKGKISNAESKTENNNFTGFEK